MCTLTVLSCVSPTHLLLLLVFLLILILMLLVLGLPSLVDFLVLAPASLSNLVPAASVLGARRRFLDELEPRQQRHGYPAFPEIWPCRAFSAAGQPVGV